MYLRSRPRPIVEIEVTEHRLSLIRFILPIELAAMYTIGIYPRKLEVCGYEIDGNRACGFVVPGGLAHRSGSLLSHSMSLGTGYRFHSFTIGY